MLFIDCADLTENKTVEKIVSSFAPFKRRAVSSGLEARFVMERVKCLFEEAGTSLVTPSLLKVHEERIYIQAEA